VASVTFDRVDKSFGDGTRAVDELSLEIADGEFMVLVGPSGCGKTTALRLVAGLEDLSAGEIRIGERPVQDLPPRRGGVAMVFQNYALYPHMNVFENMMFGLRSRGIARRKAAERVDDAGRALDLSELMKRRPGQLSGGQRQRVAMGRAIVREPHAFLMDEPLSNLDAKLRVQMRAEISRLQRQLKATTIYVTHDQVEAMTMGDRVAVMRRGKLQQCAPPQALYDRPVNLFVASFIGSPAMNFIQADVLDDDVRIGETVLPLPRGHDKLKAYRGRAVALGIRPEHLRRAGADSALRLTARVVLTESLGPMMLAHVELRGRAVVTEDVIEATTDGDDLLLGSKDDTVVAAIATLEPEDSAAIGDTIELALDPRRLHFFDLDTGAAIYA
jgi:multiple sugar transport system ATP-binding protein